ncbi:MAG: DegV family protein [Anaerolineales bacterium]|nr:DegV family protein [Anaerolineales bacterium]
MRIGLVTDSIADLPVDLVEIYNIEVVPAILVIEGKEYIDGQDITRNEFYQRLPEMRSAPTTAAPSIGTFLKAFQKQFSAGYDHLIAIHTAGTLTSIVDIACQAAVELKDKVTIIDSGQLTLGVGFQVLAAANEILKSSSLPKALQAIQNTSQRITVAGALDTMEFLRRSGRVPSPVAAVGGLLSVKPLVQLQNGTVKALGAARTTLQATERLLQFAENQGPLQQLAILHTNTESRARYFLNDWMNRDAQSLPREIRIVNLTSLIGTHLGPDAVGFAAVRAG